jgi:nucleoporin NUP42
MEVCHDEKLFLAYIFLTADTEDFPYYLTRDSIEKDLTTEQPQWILSAYGPGRDAPDQLFGGFPREQSFEEIRIHYMAGKASGNEQQVVGITGFCGLGSFEY